jgi:hypothetical protein
MDHNLNLIQGDYSEAFGQFTNDFSFDASYQDDVYQMEQNQGRRASADTDTSGTAREHPLYQKAVIGSDGLYHCPWESKDPPCNHKPEKLKCNYEYEQKFFLLTLIQSRPLILLCSKFVDSHLKPYRCKVHACENARFSSTACLLRHEREAHAMHGHGEKPFLCTYEGCERSVSGHGFPRHWNLRDHMRRVHDREPSPSSSNKTAKPTRKRKADTQSQDTSPNKRTATANTAVEHPPQQLRLSPKEQLQFRRRQVEADLQKLDDADPEDPATVQTLQNVEKSFKEMHHLVAPKSKRISQQISG